MSATTRTWKTNKTLKREEKKTEEQREQAKRNTVSLKHQEYRQENRTSSMVIRKGKEKITRTNQSNI